MLSRTLAYAPVALLSSFVAGLAACSSSSASVVASKDAGQAHEDAGQADAVAAKDAAAKNDAAMAVDVDAETPSGMTIAKARQAFNASGSSASITVNAIVTGVQGPSGDQVIWYIEDPQGGPFSGVSIFCDPLAATTCPCMASCANHVAAPPLNTLVSITGTISAYHGQLQLEPTAQTILKMNATPPPVYTATAEDLAEAGNSPYRGVYVSFPGTIKVDDTTPTALYDTECNPGTSDAGMPLCSGCEPPSYSGFEVNGPGANAFYVEELFFPFVTLASSPECLTQPGAVAVKDGQTFPHMSGILEYDGFAGKQFLAPVQPSDY